MILACQNISKSYADKAVLREVNFHIEKQDKCAIVGINGAGKTTLLRVIMGQEEADNGNVIIRTWIPYIFFVVINLCLFKIGLAGIVIAAFLDILIGIYLYRQNLDRDRIIKVIEKIKNGDVKSKVDVSALHSDNRSRHSPWLPGGSENRRS